MTTEISAVIGPNRNLALLIDADNISHTAISAIIAELSTYGTANIRRAYGDWTAGNMKGWREKLHEFAVKPVQQFSYTKGKNATDMALVIDALELLYTQKPDTICIVSSDGDFTPLVMHLRANGLAVLGFGERKTPEPFVNACTGFLYLDALIASADEQFAKIVDQKAEFKKTDTSASAKKPAAVAKPLSQNTKLVSILRAAVNACVKDDGWAALSAVGSTAKRQDSTADPRNYDKKNFTELFEAVGLFEMYKAKNHQIYVADKKNMDRSKSPAV
jgi:uncharacterized protein (TIGR00288 family)